MKPMASQRAEGPKLLSLWEGLDCMKARRVCMDATTVIVGCDSVEGYGDYD